jgi:Xaa-Pro aminopeptidase
VERNIPERIVWEGKKLSKEEAEEISGISNAFYLDEFNRRVSPYLYGAETCHINNLISGFDKPMNKSQKFVSTVRNTYPHVKFANFTNLIRSLRAIKDEWEIEQLSKAIEVTGEGIKFIYQNAKSGMHEYELEAMYLYHVYKDGLKHLGFKSIVAAGKNATILHYEQNRDKIKNGELVLLDIGALCNNYSADISRTFPIDKTFTPRQKDIYQGVLDVQKTIISMVKPNIKISDLQNKTKELLKNLLFDLKLIKEDKELSKYYMHGVSHHLGMDTHDIIPRESVLKAGNVITVEPGLYIPEESIGVRIEDDILVTENGQKNLSASIPKEVKELEEYRKNI